MWDILETFRISSLQLWKVETATLAMLAFLMFDAFLFLRVVIRLHFRRKKRWHGKRSDASHSNNPTITLEKKKPAVKSDARKRVPIEVGEFESTEEDIATLTKNIKQRDNLIFTFSSEDYTNPRSKRIVHCMDAIEWLKGTEMLEGSVITSMPDLSEMRGVTLENYRVWFEEAASLILSKLSPDACAIFYQSDIKILEDTEEGTMCNEWFDKSFVCQLAAHKLKIPLMWHKIFLIGDFVAVKFARSNYTHMVCFSKKPFVLSKNTSRDVAMRGKTSWIKGMGIVAAEIAVKFAKNNGAKVIIDPFCGQGVILAMANRMGLDAVGVELSSTIAKKARRIQIARIPAGQQNESAPAENDPQSEPESDPQESESELKES